MYYVSLDEVNTLCGYDAKTKIQFNTMCEILCGSFVRTPLYATPCTSVCSFVCLSVGLFRADR